MATFDSALEMANDAINQWLEDWQRCLELWLTGGVSAPTAQARAALRRWLSHCETAGWPQVQMLAERLLDESLAVGERAEALLDLLAWQRSARRLYQCQRLLERYGA